MVEADFTKELVVKFFRGGEVTDCFYVSDGRTAYKVARLMLELQGDELEAGDALTVTARRKPNLITQELG